MNNTEYNVLFIEDDATTNRNITQFLTKVGYRVKSSFDVYDANESWEKYMKSIKCIITDLNFNPNGLSDEKRKASNGGLYTGWLWLWEKVFSKPELIKNLPLKKAIILSAYQDYFKEYINDLNDEAQKAVYKNRTIIIPKNNPDDAEKKLLSALGSLGV